MSGYEGTNFDFIAVDFETATRDNASACQVGIVAVKDMEIVDYYESLIQPPNNRYEEQNIEVHGITPDMTETAQTMDELWSEMEPFFSANVPVIAHNAHFDMSVLRLSLKYGSVPNFVYLDSISIVSSFVKGRKSLENCAKELGVELEHHHDGLEDATATAQIVMEAMNRYGVKTIWELCAKYFRDRYKYIADINPQYIFWAKKKREPTFSYIEPIKMEVRRDTDNPKSYHHVRTSNLVPQKEANPEHPLYGKSIVFTGELSIPRETAYQMAVDCGAVVRTSVSGKTNYLVVGKQDIAIVGADGLSTKQEEAISLNARGKAHIEMIDEGAFIQLMKV